MDGMYARQDSLGIMTDQTVLVIGCGGIGSWCAYFLALAGVERIHLFDGDTISESNLNRLPFTPADVGRYKSEALSDLIRRARPDVEVFAYGNFDPEVATHRELVEMNASAVVVSTDSLKSRRLIHEAVNKLNPSPLYYELGADGFNANVTGSPAEWETPLEQEAGYASVPVMVGPCVLAASIASYYVLKGVAIPATYRADWDDERGVLNLSQREGV